MKKTAILVIATILVFAPFQAVHAAPPTDFEKQIASLKTQIQLLQMQIAKLEAGAKKETTLKVKKPKKRMNEGATGATALPKAVIKLDAEWAEREAELDAKYKIPGKWKLLDEKGIKDYKKYQEKREALLSK